MPVRIGINPLTWTNDDMPELGGSTPLDTCLTEAKLAGYDGMELGNKFPRTEAALRPVMARHALAVVSGWYSARLLERDAAAEIAAVQDHLKLLKAMGSTAMVFAEVSRAVHGERTVPLSRRPRMSDREWDSFAERIAAVGRHLAEQGVRLAYHHHMGTVVETQAEIDRLMDATGPEVGLLLDTGHLTYAGGDPLAAAKKHAGRILHVHCKDIRQDVLAQAKAEDWPFLKAVLAGVFTVPGDGMVDYPGVLGVLARQGYEGWLVVEAEQDPAKAHPLTYARMGHDYLRKTASSVGM
jgi:inosose dehydratase